MVLEERLDSWKEIAAYLCRDVRTVRRWESDRGLPVHRVPGGRRGSVFAYRAEIDEWLHRPENREELEPQEVISDSVQQEQPAKRIFGSPSSRLRRVIVAAGLSAAILALLAITNRQRMQQPQSRDGNLATPAVELDSGPRIDSVGPIFPRAVQTIAIRGRGFGMHASYRNGDSPYIAIRDKTGGWAAGRMIPQNWDEVTLSISSWTDSEIDVTEFSGAYGKNRWTLSPDDDIEVVIWNPQTGSGPASYKLHVGE